MGKMSLMDWINEASIYGKMDLVSTSIIPVKKQDWESKYKQKQQQECSATAIPLYGLR